MERAALVVHTGKPEAVALQRSLEKELAARGVEVVEESPDLVLSLGGDGTMLRAAQIAHAADALLLGVNLGALGYLTEVGATAAEDAVVQVLEGAYDIEPRMMLRCEVEGLELPEPYVALNEVLVERALRHRLLHLTVRIGGERLAGFSADGVLVATPTGSTAYALSAGGPIVSPRADCLIVVPVSAHTVVSRPVILAPDEEVEVTVRGERLEASLSLDGDEGFSLPPGIPVLIRRHERALRLVRLKGPGFLERVRTKLGLPS